MRDLVYKNLTSQDRKRRVISSSEVINKEGVRSVIRRHFVYMVREVPEIPNINPAPYIYVLKERNSKEQKEKFFCKIKGDIYAVNSGRFFRVTFLHSLNILLAAGAG